MEKRNFVTPLRTAESAELGDELIDTAAGLFSSKTGIKAASEFEKKASSEDARSDEVL